CSASAGVWSEVTSSQKNGKISARVAGTRTRCHGLNGSRNRRRGIAWADALTSWPPSRDVVPEARQQAGRWLREAWGSGGVPRAQQGPAAGAAARSGAAFGPAAAA